MDEILELLKDKPELLTKFNDIVKTSEENVKQISFLESEAKKAFEARDKAKRELLESGGDEALKAEIDNLKGLLEGSKEEIDAVKAESAATLNKMRMRDVIKQSGIDAQNDDALNAIVDLALDGVDYDDGFVWKNEDGTTRYNEAKKPYSVIDRVNELRGGDKSYLFKPQQGGGGGGAGNTPDVKAEDKPKGISAILDAGLKY